MQRSIAALLVRASAALVLGVQLMACSAAAPSSPDLLARCEALYSLWWRYDVDPTLYHTGERARAEFAQYECERGHYEAGIRELEKLLRHGGFDGPPPITLRPGRATYSAAASSGGALM